MIQTYEAMVDETGHIQLLDQVALPLGHRVLITVLEEPALNISETALLSEEALAEDWNRPEEDEAWSSLQQAHPFEPYPTHPKRAAMKKEIKAYQAIHSELVTKFLGQYVAIYQGELVDHDPDPVALHERITAKYPKKVVLSRRVQKNAEPVLQMRSPRLEHLR